MSGGTFGPNATKAQAMVENYMSAGGDVSVDVLDRLANMVEQGVRADFDADWAGMQAEIGPIAKKARNQQTNKNYADLAGIEEDIRPILEKHGFGTTTGEDASDKEGHVRIYCKVTKYGISRDAHIDMPKDGVGLGGKKNMTDLHAHASTTTYGRRYAKMMALDIATSEDDGNSFQGRQSQGQQRQQGNQGSYNPNNAKAAGSASNPRGSDQSPSIRDHMRNFFDQFKVASSPEDARAVVRRYRKVLNHCQKTDVQEFEECASAIIGLGRGDNLTAMLAGANKAAEDAGSAGGQQTNDDQKGAA